MFDPLHLGIAFVPLAMYFLVLGLVNLSRRPLITTGVRDSLALALGVSGMIVAGPMELFLPERAAQVFGGFVWVLMLLLYLLTCVLLVLMGRPRLVIYNITPAELKPILEQAIKSIDGDASWADETYVLPGAYVQLHVESFPALRNVSLVAIGPRQSWQSWRKLEAALTTALREVRGGPNPYGVVLVSFGMLLAGATAFYLAQQRAAVAQALRDMLRM